MDTENIRLLTDNPRALVQYVENIAALNEQLSEAIRDSADLLALVDPRLAISLYRGADQINQTAYSFRKAIPTIMPRTDLCYRALILVGFLCGLCAGLLWRNK